MVGEPAAPIGPHHQWSAGWCYCNVTDAGLHSRRKARRPRHVHHFLSLENPCRLWRRIRSPQERRIVRMITHIKFISIPTRNLDAALAFYTEKLGFKLVTDQPHDDKQRWIELRIGSSIRGLCCSQWTTAGLAHTSTARWPATMWKGHINS